MGIYVQVGYLLADVCVMGGSVNLKSSELLPWDPWDNSMWVALMQ